MFNNWLIDCTFVCFLSDGNSADSHSHSANSFAEPTQLSSSNKETNIRTQPEESASSSHSMISKHANSNVQDRNHNVKEVITQTQPSNIMQPNPTNGKALHPVPIDKLLPNENSISSSGPLKEDITKVEMVIKPPPKPLTQTSSLPQMPYVSTKGDGPNGKIVNGFLYRYTKSEVSIVCVCHGSTFSPAEFVQHAGGTDISHPLKHITVIPSAFGWWSSFLSSAVSFSILLINQLYDLKRASCRKIRLSDSVMWSLARQSTYFWLQELFPINYSNCINKYSNSIVFLF